MSAPKTFVSYSHEDSEHDEWALNFAANLRRNGVDASIDKWDLQGGQDTTQFMESRIRDSDFVILVCTPLYAEKSNLPRDGVGYEKNIISAEMLQAQGLNPKFIPVLRKGDFNESLPTYLGSKFAIDFRESRDQQEAITELLRTIHQSPPSTKPPLGPSPFESEKQEASLATSPKTNADKPTAIPPAPSIQVGGDIDVWEKIAAGRFEFLRTSRIARSKADPFEKGFWQGSFALQGGLNEVSLSEFLEILRASKTGLTGWDIGWVPTKEGIAPYPFKEGVEVWLAEDGDKGPAHSDFWRAEPFGRFSLFRGFQEDDPEFQKRYPSINLDYSIVLWRVTEFLLYMEKFAKLLAIPPTCGMVKFRWTGLEGRRLGFHKDFSPYGEHVCREPMIEVRYLIPNTSAIRKTLIQDVHKITRRLFESFDFFGVPLDNVRPLLGNLLAGDKGAGI